MSKRDLLLEELIDRLTRVENEMVKLVDYVGRFERAEKVPNPLGGEADE